MAAEVVAAYRMKQQLTKHVPLSHSLKPRRCLLIFCKPHIAFRSRSLQAMRRLLWRGRRWLQSCRPFSELSKLSELSDAAGHEEVVKARQEVVAAMLANPPKLT